MRLTFEDIQAIVIILKKLDDEDAAHILSVIIQILEQRK
jgi:hypothetical protein